MTRQAAWDILCEFTKSEGLRNHGLAVSICVEAYAAVYGGDPERWAVTGLLHDFDWEIHPQLPDHPDKGSLILAERGVDEEIRAAILSHVPERRELRRSHLEKCLFACDELAGLLTAISYVKPTRSIHDVDVKSVRKKMKDKAFARAVSREDILNSAADLGVDLDRHIEFCLKAMQDRATDLGLQGVVGGSERLLTDLPM